MSHSGSRDSSDSRELAVVAAARTRKRSQWRMLGCCDRMCILIGSFDKRRENDMRVGNEDDAKSSLTGALLS